VLTDSHRMPCSAAHLLSFYLLTLVILRRIGTDKSSASTYTAGEVRAIAQLGSGRSAARVVERSASLAQNRLVPAALIVESTEEERPRFVGAEDDRSLGAWGKD
jgi:hypothetical protein